MAKIEILNRALLKLGEPPLSSLSDAAFGRSYEIIYDDMKKLLLSSYPWRFEVKRVQIARDAEKYDGQYVYRLPTDFLLLLKVNENQADNDVIMFDKKINDLMERKNIDLKEIKWAYQLLKEITYDFNIILPKYLYYHFL